MQEYIEKFEAISAHVENASEDELLHKFVYGLKDKHKSHVLIQQPSTLNGAMNLALAVEDT